MDLAALHRLPVAIVLLCTLASRTPAQPASIPAPRLPFVARNLCPGEGCVYRAWTAAKDIAVYDTWDNTPRKTGSLRKGETVTALSGLVITHRPGVIHVDRDLAEAGLKRGDTILTYTYLGEGFSQVWFNGSFHEQFDISFTKWPDGTGCGGAHCAAAYVDLGEKVWWSEVKLKSGAVKWVKVDWFSFTGMNLLSGQ